MRLLWSSLLIGFLSLVELNAHAQVSLERQILLLRLASGTGEPVSVPASNDPVFLSYRTLIPTQNPLPGQVYVRVFRGTKKYLINTMPKSFKKGCVDYSAALLTVNAGGQLAFQGMNTEWLSSNRPEHFTLVFEAADPNSPGNSMLRLSNDPISIAAYFNSGIEIQLLPPDGFVMPVRVTSPPSTSTKSYTSEPPVDLPPCHVVQDYRAGSRKTEGHPVEVASMKLKEVPCGL